MATYAYYSPERIAIERACAQSYHDLAANAAREAARQIGRHDIDEARARLTNALNYLDLAAVVTQEAEAHECDEIPVAAADARTIAHEQERRIDAASEGQE